jgi:DNA ligase-1
MPNSLTSPPRPMLAANEPWRLPLPPSCYPLLASPKIDGERALVTPAGVFSRSGKKIPSPFIQSVLSHPSLHGLDGEITVGPATAPDVRRQTAAIRRLSPAPLDFTFHVFDDWRRSYTPFNQIIEPMWQLPLPPAAASRISIVLQEIILNETDLLRAEERALSAGYEGLILRSPSQPYKHGRCTLKEFLRGAGMLKLKRRQDAEAVILAARPLQRNENPLTYSPLGLAERSTAAEGKYTDYSLLGTILVRPLPDPSHSFALPFWIGAGVIGTWDEAERRRLMLLHTAGKLVGKTITFRYFPSGGKDRPVQPQFVAFRSPSDR